MTLQHLPAADGQPVQRSHEPTAPGLDAPPQAANDGVLSPSEPATAPAPPQAAGKCVPQEISEAQGNQQPVASSPAHSQTAKACTFDRYGEGWGRLMLRMVPRRTLSAPAFPFQTPPWTGRLAVKCDDVPRLMREGFFWSANNILREEGYFGHSLRHEWTTKGYRHVRTWILADRPSGGESENPRWVGRLEVVSASLELLSGFRVDKLSSKNVCGADAWDARDHAIYHYKRNAPGDNYNSIYDDRPLRGWWPWPKDDGSDTGISDYHWFFGPSADWADIDPDYITRRRQNPGPGRYDEYSLNLSLGCVVS